MSPPSTSNSTAASSSIGMRDRKASISTAPHYITQGLTVHTVSTPDEIPAPPTTGGLGSYFSLSRTPSSGGRPLSRRPSLTSSNSAPPAAGDPGTIPSSTASTFSLMLSHPRTPSGPPKMFARSNTGTLPPALPTSSSMGSIPTGPTSPNGMYGTVHETCTKRIATLDYLRRAHEGRVYFFNVMLTPRSDLQKLVYPDVRKLQKKATNYFTLGNSLPNILDAGTTLPLDYLKAFNALLQEYETHIALPPSRQPTTRAHSSSISLGTGTGSGSSGSSLRSMSLPKFFSRAGHNHYPPKPRRGSTVTASSVPDLSHTALERTRSSSNSSQGPPSVLANEDMLPPLPLSLPPPFPTATLNSMAGEEYVYLNTPALPFDPDYFETFATLCDVLIDVYSRVLSLVNTPSLCGPGVGEAFLKADGRIRRIVISGTVREWEDAVRGGVKREIGGVAREVLGGML